MATYTTTVKTICESLINPQNNSDYLTIGATIEAAIPSIFDYTIGLKIDEKDIEKQILSNYYLREIAFETPGLWKLKMKNLFFANKDKYNSLYDELNIENAKIFDDFRTFEDRQKTDENTGELTANGTTTATTENTSTAERIDNYSDTPQNGLTAVKDGNYLTTADYQKDDGTESTTGSTTSESSQNTKNKATENESVTRHGRGGTRTTAELLATYGTTMQTLTTIILDDFAPLFMAIY